MPRRDCPALALGEKKRLSSDQDRKDLQAFVDGNPKAAKMLIARYASALVNHASYMLSGDRFMAEDVVQNSFLKLWNHADNLLQSDRALNLRAWLFQVTRNGCLDELRRVRGADWDENAEYEDPSASALDVMSQQERAKEAWALIARLPERQKSALLMSHFEAMGNAEIALVLDCSVEAVENLLARARRSLRSWGQKLEMSQ